MVNYQKLISNIVQKVIVETYNNKNLRKIVEPLKDTLNAQLYPIYIVAYAVVILITIILLLVLLILLLVLKKL